MIKEITAKKILSSFKEPDPWFGIKYNMNLYRGCQHQCIYCDSRSECYGIENFRDILVKKNSIELLRRELSGKRIKGTIGTGSMNDPYMPAELNFNLTAQALEVIAEFKFPLHVITKSDLVLRDLDTITQISRVYAAVSITVTTCDDEMGKTLEPGAPLVSKRFKAMKILASKGIFTGVTLMPVLPFIEDNSENITTIIKMAHDSGASYILPAFGMTLRDRQRAYYYDELDKSFPGIREKYEGRYGEKYSCNVPDYKRLEQIFYERCSFYGVETKMRHYSPQKNEQLKLF